MRLHCTLLLAAAVTLLAALPITRATAAGVDIPFTPCSTTAAYIYTPIQLTATGLQADGTMKPGDAIQFTLNGTLTAAVTDGMYQLLVQQMNTNTEIATLFGKLSAFTPIPVVGPNAAFTFAWTLPADYDESDQPLTMQLDMYSNSKTQDEIVCISASLHVTPAPAAAKSKSLPLGYMCALISVLFFGQLLP